MNPLKPLLNGLISPNQPVFVPNHLIQDSIILAQEAFHFLDSKKRGNKGSMALKLDLNEAYDRVEWDYLEVILRKMGLNEKWINLIIQYVSNVSYNFVVNCSIVYSIRPERGLRQGAPLSPYLFLLVQDILFHMLAKVVRLKDISGIQLRRNSPLLSHLFFANDSIVFLNANSKDCLNLLSILSDYSAASGQLVSLSKSGIIFSANVLSSERFILSSI